MTEEKLKELLKKVSSMSFEEGKQYIKSKYPNVTAGENYDKQVFENDFLYDCNFVFDDDNDVMITFTSSYIETEEENIVNYDAGYWHIHGER